MSCAWAAVSAACVVAGFISPPRLPACLDSGATSSVWWATRNEWLGLLDVAGLELEALYGGFDREPFTSDSHEYVFVARRPG